MYSKLQAIYICFNYGPKLFLTFKNQPESESEPNNFKYFIESKFYDLKDQNPVGIDPRA